ncbi:MAG: FxsA family protein [Paracoccaceae bacterium]
MWLLVPFIAVPLIEIALFITVGGWLTLWPTLGLVLLTAVIGTALVRHQGMAVLNDLRRSLHELNDPTAPIANGAMILLAGALLLTPGFLTDAFGFALLVPAVRRAAMRFLARRVQIIEPGGAFGAGKSPGTGGETIDGEFDIIDDAPRKPSGPSGWTRH